jgi:hypothetical protein
MIKTAIRIYGAGNENVVARISVAVVMHTGLK